ncbi:MAG: hypothetical protein HUJ80_03180 [Firmicutes bacterium]|nr:hypothetical protein [Bacillota bacterium]
MAFDRDEEADAPAFARELTNRIWNSIEEVEEINRYVAEAMVEELPKICSVCNCDIELAAKKQLVHASYKRILTTMLKTYEASEKDVDTTECVLPEKTWPVNPVALLASGAVLGFAAAVLLLRPRRE